MSAQLSFMTVVVGGFWSYIFPQLPYGLIEYCNKSDPWCAPVAAMIPVAIALAVIIFVAMLLTMYVRKQHEYVDEIWGSTVRNYVSVVSGVLPHRASELPTST